MDFESKCKVFVPIPIKFTPNQWERILLTLKENQPDLAKSLANQYFEFYNKKEE